MLFFCFAYLYNSVLLFVTKKKKKDKRDGEWFWTHINMECHSKVWEKSEVFYVKFMQHFYPAKSSRFQGLPVYCIQNKLKKNKRKILVLQVMMSQIADPNWSELPNIDWPIRMCYISVEKHNWQAIIQENDKKGEYFAFVHIWYLHSIPTDVVAFCT